jgi:hypothetical protein
VANSITGYGPRTISASSLGIPLNSWHNGKREELSETASMSRIVSMLLVFALAGAARAQAQPEPLVKKVKTSIAKGVDFLVGQQRDDGSWEEPKDDKNISRYHGGPTALVLLALLNCDGVLDDPKLETKRKKSVERGLANLRAIDSPKVYVQALQTMALCEAGELKKDLAQIKRNVDWLLEARVYRKGDFIGWEYENRKGLGFSDSDGSNSQYAMLALWHARQAGIPIDRKVWEEIRDYYTRTQNQDGYWIYSLGDAPDELKGPSGTMTVAGLCAVLIAGMELNGEREQWQVGGRFKNCGDYRENVPAAKALQWLNKNFTVELPHRIFYHLYGLERAGRLSGQRFFGEHDWYREGCEYLTKSQRTDGSWQGTGLDRWPHVNTSFALLFLSKGRTPVLISKLVHGNWPRREDDLDWNNDRNDLRHLTEYLSRSDLFNKKPLAWQTYDIMRALYARNQRPTKDDETAIVADMRQAPILYITGHEHPQPRIQEAETALIKRYVENGGFLFAEACCGEPDFDKGIKQWVKDNWPGHELKYLEATHPVWSCFNTVPAGDPHKLMGLQVGCRTIMLYSPQDLSCHWESNRYKDGPSQRAFELGANIVAYATGRIPPQPRLTPIEIAGDVKATKEPRARGAFQVGQIYHQGDWQPAPNAMTNLMEHVHKVTGLDVMLHPEKILLFDRSVIHAKFLYMHGRDRFDVKTEHLEHLRFTLENGGLLLADACCGNETFDKSFRKFAQELFPKEKLVRVPADAKERDPLFGADLNGEVLSAAKIRCRTKANERMLPMEPFLEGIKVDGRWVVLYSKYDLGCALERNTSADCIGYDHASALRIATAVVRYHTRP